MNYVTNYTERDTAREAYLAFLSRSEHALRDRPLPDLEPKTKLFTPSINGKATLTRSQILNSI